MKSPATFEIKVAIIGNVSAGKTTVLNALFRDKYGDVSMKRTTAGVNEFAIGSRKEWNLMEDDEPADAKSILTEITHDNVKLRASDQVQTKRFRIELDEPLCEMRKDTQLVIVDVPGVNEAHTSQKYWDYVENHWETFDCVVVVMDGRQGVNTECQVSLLQNVKANHSKKQTPIVILFNKVDDPDDEEQAELVMEAQQEVEKVFGVPDRQKSLEGLLQYDDSQKSPEVHSNTAISFCPVFIPISAIGAFIFQTCSSMTLEKFREFDVQLVAKLGREYVGKRKWKKLSREEQIQAAYEAVSDPEGYQEGLEDSNFHRFLQVLEVLIGGEAVQTKLIQDQIHFSLASISWGTGVVDRLEVIHKKMTGLESEWSSGLAQSLKETFWKLCKERESLCSCRYNFEYSVELALVASKHFVELANELIKYKNLAASLGWKAEADLAATTFEKCFFLWVESRECFYSNLVSDLKVVYAKVQEMSGDAPVNPSVLEAMKKLFVPLYETFERSELAKFDSAKALDHVSKLANSLTEYGKFVMEVGWDDQTKAMVGMFQELVRKQIRILCEAATRNISIEKVFLNKHKRKKIPFCDLSPEGWIGVFRSILLLVYSKRFCMDFGSEIVWMEHLVDRYVAKARYEDVKLSHIQHDSRGLSVSDVFGSHHQVLIVPSSITQPNHFGYVAWKYSELMDGRIEKIVNP